MTKLVPCFQLRVALWNLNRPVICSFLNVRNNDGGGGGGGVDGGGDDDDDDGYFSARKRFVYFYAALGLL